MYEVIFRFLYVHMFELFPQLPLLATHIGASYPPLRLDPQRLLLQGVPPSIVLYVTLLKTATALLDESVNITVTRFDIARR